MLRLAAAGASSVSPQQPVAERAAAIAPEAKEAQAEEEAAAAQEAAAVWEAAAPVVWHELQAWPAERRRLHVEMRALVAAAEPTSCAVGSGQLSASPSPHPHPKA